MKSYNKNYLGRIHENKNQELKYMTPLDEVKDIKELEEVDVCPMCGKKHYVVVGNIPINVIIDYWVNSYGFNPIADIYRNKILEKRCCSNCGLYFYNYHLSDCERMYKELTLRSSYYPSFRQEYGIATEFIEDSKPKSLIEIGSGNGAFLKRIENIIPQVTGSEYNKEAFMICKNQGLDMKDEDISLIKEKFDVVCHFEVLEHVFNTHEFMEKTLNLLDKGGKLIIGTPDPEGISSVIGRFQLNLPPHHQFDFSRKTFDWLANKYNLNIVFYQKTELDYHHYARYVKVLTGKDLTNIDMPGFYETKKIYSGTSHVVVFEKL